jgi:hypothetical protein
VEARLSLQQLLGIRKLLVLSLPTLVVVVAAAAAVVVSRREEGRHRLRRRWRSLN